MFEKYLQEIGLSDKEAQVYVELLKTDHSSVLDLAKTTGIKRPTVYVVLTTLAEKGLVSETQIGKKTHYQAEPPERLESYLERQKTVLDEHTSRLKDVIPQLKSIQRASGAKPVVKYFEGKEGILSSYDEFVSIYKKGDIVRSFYSKDLVDEIFSDHERKQLKHPRLHKHVHGRSLYTFSKGEYPTLVTDDVDRLCVEKTLHPITCDIAICEDQVKISVLGEKLSGIFIRSKDVADTLASLFELAFEGQKIRKK